MNVDRLVSLIQILNNIIDTKIWLKIKMCIRCVNMIIIKEWNYFRCVGFLKSKYIEMIRERLWSKEWKKCGNRQLIDVMRIGKYHRNIRLSNKWFKIKQYKSWLAAGATGSFSPAENCQLKKWCRILQGIIAFYWVIIFTR